MRKQTILTVPAKLFKEKYLTAKGQRLIKSLTGMSKKDFKTASDLIWKKYGKNRYLPNPDSKLARDKKGKCIIIYHEK